MIYYYSIRKLGVGSSPSFSNHFLPILLQQSPENTLNRELENLEFNWEEVNKFYWLDDEVSQVRARELDLGEYDYW